ncbi:MAG: flagellar hook capping protein [Sporomusaceae bacterium]|nr:flagellar hook capping protein [Sporomusaceae bacterium]
MSAINTSVTNNTATNSNANSATKQNSLGKDDFLKMLVTQLQNQDPLKPMDDTAFVAQMAQFSTLEQMKNMNTAALATQANGMIGNKVTWTNDKNEVLEGAVRGVNIVSGESKLIVDVNAITYESVMPTQTTELLDKQVSWVDDNKVTHSGIITKAEKVGGSLTITAASVDANGTIINSSFDSKNVTSLIVSRIVEVNTVSMIQR